MFHQNQIDWLIDWNFVLTESSPSDASHSLVDKFDKEVVKAFVDHMMENGFTEELAIKALQSDEVNPEELDEGKDSDGI